MLSCYKRGRLGLIAAIMCLIRVTEHNLLRLGDREGVA